MGSLHYELTDELQRSRATDTYHKVHKKLTGYDLLVIDELGFRSFSAKGTDDFFEVIRRRYECRSTIVTTNRDFQGWEAMLGDAVIASAIIDRLVHHGHVIKILGDSYRLNSALEAKTNTQTTQDQSP